MSDQTYLHTSTVAIPWQLTHLLHSRNYSKTLPVTLNSEISFPYTGRFYSTDYSFFLSSILLYLSFMTGLTDYININKQLKQRQKSFTTPMTKTTAIAGYRARFTCERPNINYGSPPWNTGAALRFLSLRRDFLQDCWRSNAALKLRSSTRRCC